MRDKFHRRVPDIQAATCTSKYGDASGMLIVHIDVRRKRQGLIRAEEIEFLRQRTLSSVEWQEFEEASKVVIHLDVALASRIDGDSKSRRPLIGEAVCVSISRN